MTLRIFFKCLVLFIIFNVKAYTVEEEVGSGGWVQQMMQEYPELAWLADDKVRITQEAAASEKGGSWSERLYGKKYPEFDRTMLSLVNLNLFLEGTPEAYQKFTSIQPPEQKLSFESFQAVNKMGQALLTRDPSRMRQAMVAALILGDMGKTEKARELAKPYGVSKPDHDDFIEEALKKCPQIFPTFMGLPASSQRLILNSENLIHFGHFTHLEGNPDQVLGKVVASGVLKEDPEALDFALFIHRCDVAAAAGHVKHEGSLVYTQNTHEAIEAIKAALENLKEGDAKSAYMVYLKKRAEWLELNSETAVDRVLARLGAMLRLFKPEEGVSLKRAAERLDPSTWEEIVLALDPLRDQPHYQTPTYVPAVYVNMYGNKALGETPDERLRAVVEIGVPFVAQILKGHLGNVQAQKTDPDIPLCFNGIAGVAKGAEAKSLLKTSRYKVDSEGNVDIES